MGAKNKPRDDIRDTLYFKNENSKNNFRKVTTFREFRLTSNGVFLDPSLTAKHLFKTKSTHNNDIRRSNKLARNIKNWQKSNGPGPYIEMPDQDDVSDNEVGQNDTKGDTKGFTKKSFKEPMSRL